MQLVKVLSSQLDNLKRWRIKIQRFGKDDIQTPMQAAPFGIDSNPPAGMVAVYSSTSEKGKNVVVGYLNKDQLSAPGESRLFSVDGTGSLSTYVWVKSDGSIQLGGTEDHAVRFSKLETALDNMVQIINQNLPLIQAGITAGGGSYAPITVTLNLTPAKITKITVPNESI